MVMASTHDPESLSSPQLASPPPQVQDKSLSQRNGETSQSPHFPQSSTDTESRRHRGQRSSNASSKGGSRWHHTLHPHVRREGERNSLPKGIAHLMHPTHALLIHTGSELGSGVDGNAVSGVTGHPIAASSNATQSKPGSGSKARRHKIANMHHQRREQKWTSRNERKHRFVAVAPTGARSRSTKKSRMEKPATADHEHREEAVASKTKDSRYAKNLAVGIWHMLVRIEYWNVSWWVAQFFTWGSVIWVINGFASFLPFGDSAHYEPAFYCAGWTAFIGATVFEFGSILGMWEAWNREDTAGFGWSIKEALEGVKVQAEQSERRVVEDVEAQIHRQPEKVPTRAHTVSRKPVPAIGDRRNSDPSNENADLANNSPSYHETQTLNSQEKEKEKAYTDVSDSSSLTFTGTLPPHLRKKWIWFSLDRKYFREIGFLAAFFQFWAATIFWISGFTAIPTIQLALEKHTPALNGAFWAPQVIGGSGFVISATFIMLETQQKWWKPNLTSLGWHVGFWNFVGGVGFTLCGALGFAATASHGAAYQSALSTFWGGWAFLIGSLLQWYESVNSVEQ